MQLDGFTFIAQIVNFLILVYLLKRFLYRPVLAVMERREADIGARLRQAQTREQAATETIEAYQAKTRDLEQNREQLLARIRTETDAERARQREAVRGDIEQLRRDWQHELSREQARFVDDARRQLSQAACRLTRRILTDLADAALEDQLLSVFLRRLRELGPDQQQALAESCSSADAEITVVSAFVLTPIQQQRLREALRALLDKDIPVRFQQQPEPICGIRLDTPQQMLGWNVNDHLEQLEQQLLADLSAFTPTAATAAN